MSILDLHYSTKEKYLSYMIIFQVIKELSLLEMLIQENQRIIKKKYNNNICVWHAILKSLIYERIPSEKFYINH